jgi:hypothetical protein
MTRGGIYCYYKYKDDILRQLIESVTIAGVQLKASAKGATWEEKLQQTVQTSTLWLIDGRTTGENRRAQLRGTCIALPPTMRLRLIKACPRRNCSSGP